MLSEIELNKVRYLRKKQGLTVEQLAMLSGLSKSTVSEIERGIKIPGQISMVRISHSLGMPTHHVFNLHYDILNL